MNRLAQAILKSNKRPLLGAVDFLYNPTFLEIAALLHYDVAWIEMEHTFITFAEAADLCRIASGLGMLTMIRIPDARRETVLKAAECGPDIIDLPMASTPEDLQDLVRNARFPPLGTRGFFSFSRAVSYGVKGKVSEAQRALNDELCLMVQIENREAVDRIEELCRVPGVDAIFIGPGDLSASLGVPGELRHPLVHEAAAHTVRVARSHGKHIAVTTVAEDFGFWIGQGVDILFCANDIASLRLGAQRGMEDARSAIAASAMMQTAAFK
jgi:2-keto-3-deoxy-L-rhamnonate aldolase RhmA